MDSNETPLGPRPVPRTAESCSRCRVGGKPKFRGEWVRHGNRQALLLL
jgi:hypothetical protein